MERKLCLKFQGDREQTELAMKRFVAAVVG